MSNTANHLKRGQFIYVEGHVYEIVDVKNVKNSHSVHFTVQDFVTNHRSEKSFGLTQHVRTVEPETHHYNLSHLLDTEGSRQFVCLVDSNGKPREDLYVEDPTVVQALSGLTLDAENPAKVTVTRLHVDHLHRNETDVDLEKITFISGVDMKHLYDHHHHHHHN